MSSDGVRQRLLVRLCDGGFCSGQALATEFGLSRAAIGKHIHALKGMGVNIDAVTGKGYRLRDRLELLDAAAITAGLTGAAAGLIRRLEILPVIGSTSDYLAAQRERIHGHAVLAEHQSAGRGRHGRSWLSPYGGSLALSLRWRFEGPPATLSGISLALAVAVIDALEDGHACGIGVKWPNDIIFQQQKLAGILVEMTGESLGPVDTVIGVGVNLAIPRQWVAAIDQPVIDLKSIRGTDIARNRLAAALLSNLVNCCQRFAEQGFAAFRQAWMRRDVYRDRPVSLRVGDKRWTGINCGVDDNGALLLRHGESLRAYHAGEIEQTRFSS